MKVFTKRLSIKVLAILLLGVLSFGGLFLHNGVKTAAAETGADPTQSVKVTDLLETTATVTQDENGLRLSSDTAYTGTFKGVFMGDTTLKFTFPETFDESKGSKAYYGDFGIRITDATDPTNYFDIKYYVVNTTNHYTALYVQHKDELRMVLHSGSDWYNTQQVNKMNYRVSPSFLSYCGTTGQYAGDRMGILSLIWEDDVLSVQANSPTQAVATNMITQAKFDGTYNEKLAANGFVNRKTWGLPKLNFANGYTISISSSFEHSATTDQGTDVCFSEIAGVNVAETSFNASYACEATFEKAVVSNNDVYIPQNEEVGEIGLVYSLCYGEEGWQEREKVNITQAVDVSTVGTKSLTITDDAWKSTPLGAISLVYNLHVETPYTLTFDVAGGEPIEKIIHSEHTSNRISVSDAEKAFWNFEGWYIGNEKWDGSLSQLYGKSVTLTAHWVDPDAPTIRLNNINDKTYETKGTTLTIGKADVVARDDAQDEGVVVTFALRKPNETAFSAITEGYKLTLDTIGSYVIQYTAMDPAGYSATCERTVEVFERNAPTITVEEGFATQTNPGLGVAIATATAKNAVGEALDVTFSVVKDGELIKINGTEFVPVELGEYTVTFFAADKAPYNNLYSVYSYTIVVVEDAVAPVIGNEFTDMTVKPNTLVTIPTITATDNISENVVVNISVYYGTQKIELTNNSFKAEQEGVYRVVLIAEDEAGNKAEKIVYVTVAIESGNVGGCGCSSSSASGGLGLPMGLLMIAGSFVFGKNIMMKKMKRKENI